MNYVIASAILRIGPFIFTIVAVIKYVIQLSWFNVGTISVFLCDFSFIPLHKLSSEKLAYYRLK